MASSKLIPSLSSRNSDLHRKSSTSSSPRFDFSCTDRLQNDAGSSNLEESEISVDRILGNVYGDESQEDTLLTGDITLLDAAGAIEPIGVDDLEPAGAAPVRKRTVDEVWREIVEGKREGNQMRRRKMETKEEAMDQMMTLEDFLVKAGAVDEAAVAEVKAEVPTESLSRGIFGYDTPIGLSPLQSAGSSGTFTGPLLSNVDGVAGYGNAMEMIGGGIGRGKRRRRNVLENLDEAAQQRQRRMIKNRESAARSRERKQAYQAELESMAVRLEEENERLLKQKAEWTRERFKQLMEKVIPVLEKRRPQRVLKRVRSMEW